MSDQLKTVQEKAWDAYCDGHKGDMIVQNYWKDLPEHVQDHFILASAKRDFEAATGNVTNEAVKLPDVKQMRKTIFGVVPNLAALFEGFAYSKTVMLPNRGGSRVPRPEGFLFMSSSHPKVQTWRDRDMNFSLGTKPKEQVYMAVRDRCCGARVGSFELIEWKDTGVTLALAIDTHMIASPWLAFVPSCNIEEVNFETVEVRP